MQVHDRVVAALVAVDDGVRVQSHNQEVSLRRRRLQKVQVPHMEHVERSRHIHYFIARLKQWKIVKIGKRYIRFTAKYKFWTDLKALRAIQKVTTVKGYAPSPPLPFWIDLS